MFNTSERYQCHWVECLLNYLTFENQVIQNYMLIKDKITGEETETNSIL